MHVKRQTESVQLQAVNISKLLPLSRLIAVPILAKTEEPAIQETNGSYFNVYVLKISQGKDVNHVSYFSGICMRLYQHIFLTTQAKII